jgi:hypothetical protein
MHNYKIVYEEEEKIRRELGAENLLDEIEKVLSTRELEDTLAYIAKQWNIETELKEIEDALEEEEQ